MTNDRSRLPPGQQLVAPHKWPIIGERTPFEPSELDRDTWPLSCGGLVKHPKTWTVAELRQMPQTEMTVDIHCVTRWSKYGMQFKGVLLKDLFDIVGVSPEASYVSFRAYSHRDHSTSLSIQEAVDLNTLVALEYGGEPLPAEHGGPLRTVVPRKYFYKSLKWLRHLELLDHDELGYWEAESGYHNVADPWREQRYMAPTISKREAARLIASRDFDDKDLRSIDAEGRDLDQLSARRALLRDANFNSASLRKADFRQANLSNAHLRSADLREADLSDADLEGADFAGADLRDTDLRGASLFGASFFDADAPDSKARIDQTTRFPDNAQEVLTEDQAEFVQHRNQH